MIVECITRPSGVLHHKEVTIGNNYKVVETKGDAFYKIIDDTGKAWYYLQDYFKEIEKKDGETKNI